MVRLAVTCLLALGIAASPNANPLHDAVMNEDLDQVSELVSGGADVNEKDQMGSTALHWTAYAGLTDISRLLLDKGAEVNVKDKLGGLTPLHWAVLKARTDMVDLLIARGADVNALDNDGDTPLDYANSKKNTELANVLMANGAKRGEAGMSRNATTQSSAPLAESFIQSQPPPAAGAPDVRIQLASLRSGSDAARDAWGQLQRDYPDLLGNLTPSVEEAELGGNGVFYRLQAGPLSAAEAENVCEMLKQKGQACMVVRP